MRARARPHSLFQQRISVWQQRASLVHRAQQEPEVRAIRHALPEYAALHSPVVQEVLARLDRTAQVFFCSLLAYRVAGVGKPEEA